MSVSRVLVVGIQPRNLDHTVAKDPRVVLWCSGERPGSDLPAGVSEILITRWDHKLSAHTRELAKARNIKCRGPFPTNVLKREINIFLSANPFQDKQEQSPVPATNHRPTVVSQRQLNVVEQACAMLDDVNVDDAPVVGNREESVAISLAEKSEEIRPDLQRGILTEFTRHNADLLSPSPAQEIQRLNGLAETRGYHFKSLGSTYYRLRRDALEKGAPQSDAPAIKPETISADADVEETDSMRFLKENAELLAVSVMEVIDLAKTHQRQVKAFQEEISALREENRRLLKFRDRYQAIRAALGPETEE